MLESAARAFVHRVGAVLGVSILGRFGDYRARFRSMAKRTNIPRGPTGRGFRGVDQPGVIGDTARLRGPGGVFPTERAS